MALAVVLVVGAGGVRVIGQRAGQQRFGLCVRRAARAGVQRNARLGQRCARTAADAAADQRVHAVRFEKHRQRPVAAAVCVHDLAGSDLAVLHRVQLELLRVAEMLEYQPVFIGDSDLHICILRYGLIPCAEGRAARALCAPLAAAAARPGAQLIGAALHMQQPPVHQHVRQLGARGLVQGLHCGSRHTHLPGAFLLRQAQKVDQADGLVLIYCQDDVFGRRAVQRAKAGVARRLADAPALYRTRHGKASFVWFCGQYNIINGICQ